MKNYLKEIIEDKTITNWNLIIFLSLINLLVIVILHNYIFTREFFNIVYSSEHSPTFVDFLYTLKIKFAIWKYLAVPVVILLRSVFIALLLQLSLMIRLIDAPFTKLFKISILGLSVLMLIPIVQMINLFIIPTKSFTKEIINFIPLSLSEFVDINNTSSILAIILNSVNVFEIIWIFLIAYGLKTITKLSTINSVITSFAVWCLIFLFQIGILLFNNKLFE